MKTCVFMGSPRKQGNTAALAGAFLQQGAALGAKAQLHWLYDKTILPCLACRACQQQHSGFGCCRQDDAHALFEAILGSELLVLATPIYSWYCTPPMKALLDRMVYGMNKYYGEEKGPSLWAGKKLALITTCGYPPEKGADLWEAGMQRYCRHSQLQYLGMLAEHDPGYKAPFMSEAKAGRAAAFARQVYGG